MAKINQDNQATILGLEEDLVDLRILEYKAIQEVYKAHGREGTLDELRIREDILNAEIKRNEIVEKIKRNASITYDYYKSMKDEIVEFHDMSVTAMKDFTTGFSSGLGNMWFQLTTGFQEAQQEATNIKSQIKGLQQEKNEITADGTKTIFSKEDAERLQEINSEMSKLKNQVDDLNNPIKNLGNTFKTFFKDLIDNINKAISQWLAMQLVMKGISYLFGGGSGVLAPSSDFSSAFQLKANGGVVPHIESFRKFSKGGLTSGLTSAIIGDNRSGVELVIPSENISSDEVSGYVRDSSNSNVYIANVITENDFAGMLSKPVNGKVIVNRILSDIDGKGPVFKKLGGR